MPITHYEILGIKKEASLKEITRKYNKLISIWDPNASWVFEDHKKDIKIISERISNAYETLSDEIKRVKYDISLVEQELAAYEEDKESVLYDAIENTRFRLVWAGLKKEYENYKQLEQEDIQEDIQDLKESLESLTEITEKAEKELRSQKRKQNKLYKQHVQDVEILRMRQQEIVELKKENEKLQKENHQLRTEKASNNNQASAKSHAKKKQDNLNLTPRFFGPINNNVKTSKIVPVGLTLIRKILSYPDNNNANVLFKRVELVFENINLVLAFMGDYYRDSKPQIQLQNDYHCIKLCPEMHTALFDATLENPKKAGELVLAEFSKQVEISGFEQRFFDEASNREIDEDYVPEEFKTALTEQPSPP